MHRSDLLSRIQKELSTPQKSERWSMYRLIVPIIDFANSTLGLIAYFEFNQTSTHGTSQSVDIALLAGDDPRVMIEAKRLDRRIAAEQISKYLTPGVRGLVANGVDWVLCQNDKNKAVSLYSQADGLVDGKAFDEIVAFIRGSTVTDSVWSVDSTYIDPTVRPEKPRKETTARRISNAVRCPADVAAMRSEVAGLTNASVLEKLFLESMMNQFEMQGGRPQHLCWEVRSSRVAFFDQRIAAGSKRVARIELGKKYPDILVLTELSAGTELSKISTPAPHDKGQHMRRFRLSREDQSRWFGTKLAEILSA